MAGPNAIPALGTGEYGTETDNENNAGTGIADGDMGGTSAPCIYNTSSNAPIEFNIALPAFAAGAAGTLNMNVWDVDTNTIPGNPEIDKVYVNNVYVGTLTGSDGRWGINYFSIPGGTLRQGNNLVQIFPDTGNPGAGRWCVAVEWGIIKVNPTTANIVRAWVAPIGQARGQYVNFFAEVTGTFSAVLVYNAAGTKILALSDSDGDKIWSGQWKIPLNTPTGDFKFTLKGYTGRNVVATWPALKVQ